MDNEEIIKEALLTDREISLALSKEGYTDEIHAELKVVAKAQLEKLLKLDRIAVLDNNITYDPIVNAVIEWLRPYIKKNTKIGDISSGGKIIEWIICDQYGDEVDEPSFSLDKIISKVTGEGLIRRKIEYTKN